MELPDAAPASPRLTTSLAHRAVAILLLSCALSMLLGTGPAYAQGTVSGATITMSPAMVTVPVGTPATFTATIDGTKANPDTYWTVTSGPIYSWWAFGGNELPTMTDNATFSSAGTHTYNVSCSVSYKVQYARGATATIEHTFSAPITIYVIGGPLSGTNDIHWYRDPGN